MSNPDPEEIVEEEEEECLCTFAVTGTTPTFQEIYICNTCSEQNICGENDNSGEVMPLCICQGCAESCHTSKGHDVEYYGSGPCYCDCSSFHQDVANSVDSCGCNLLQKSIEKAERLGISQNTDKKNCSTVNPALEGKPTDSSIQSHNDFPYLFQTYTMPSLVSQCDALIDQAIELIQHSRDTHWVPHNYEPSGYSDICGLEQLALDIFHRHVSAFNLQNQIGIDAGAEFWVQVKKLSDEHKSQAIDLHYDKDEDLAEAFNIGSFPTLSTVSYLTGSVMDSSEGKVCTAPTLVFPHTYEMPGEGEIGTFDNNNDKEEDCKVGLKPTVAISHPRVGKHLVFDGRLLHGAPSNNELRQTPDIVEEEHCSSQSHHQNIRVTFLVNIWLSRRPSRVSVLPSKIRQEIIRVSKQENLIACKTGLLMNETEITNVLQSEEDLEEDSNHKIHLSFVSSGATWIVNDDDIGDEEGLVVSILPPKRSLDDTVLVKYQDRGPELEYTGPEYDEESVTEDE